MKCIEKGIYRIYNKHRLIDFILFCVKEKRDRAERHDFWSRFLLTILLFFFHLFLGGKRKGEKKNQSHGQKACLSVSSKKKASYLAPY